MTNKNKSLLSKDDITYLEDLVITTIQLQSMPEMKPILYSFKEGTYGRMLVEHAERLLKDQENMLRLIKEKNKN